MAEVLLDEQGFPATPSAGKLIAWPDSSNSEWVQKNDNGRYLGDQSSATIAQIPSHSANTYYKGNQLPSFSMQTGMFFEWEFVVVKGAGTAAPIFTIVIGANQSIADTVRQTMTLGVQTAVADTGVVRVNTVVRSVGVTGVLQGMVHLQHNLAITGLATTPAGLSIVQNTAAGFDNTALGGLYIGLCVNPGTAAAWVVEQCVSRIMY